MESESADGAGRFLACRFRQQCLDTRGSLALTGGSFVAVYDLEKRELRDRSRKARTREISKIRACCAFGSERVAWSCGKYLELSTLETVTMEPHSRVQADARNLTDLAFNCFDENLLACSSTGPAVHVFDVRTKGTQKSYVLKQYSTGTRTYLDWNRVNRFLLCSSEDASINLWDIRKTNSPILRWPAHTKTITSLRWDPRRSTRLVSGAQDKLAKTWRLSERYHQTHSERNITVGSSVAQVECVSLGDAVATLGMDGTRLHLWNLERQHVEHVTAVPEQALSDKGSATAFSLFSLSGNSTWSENTSVALLYSHGLFLWSMSSDCRLACRKHDSLSKMKQVRRSSVRSPPTSATTPISINVPEDGESNGSAQGGAAGQRAKRAPSLGMLAYSPSMPSLDLAQEFARLETEEIPLTTIRSMSLGKRSLTACIEAPLGFTKLVFEVNCPSHYPYSAAATVRFLEETDIDEQINSSLAEYQEVFRKVAAHHAQHARNSVHQILATLALKVRTECGDYFEVEQAKSLEERTAEQISAPQIVTENASSPQATPIARSMTPPPGGLTPINSYMELRSTRKKLERSWTGLINSPLQAADPALEDAPPATSGTSNIMSPQHIAALWKHVPERVRWGSLVLLYSSLVSGVSFSTFYHKAQGYSNTFLVIEDEEKHVFGAFATAEWQLGAGSKAELGSGESFLFSLAPHLRFYHWREDHEERLFQTCDRKLIAFGGGSNGFALCVADNFETGSSNPSATYKNERLSGSSPFVPVQVELWAIELEWQ